MSAPGSIERDQAHPVIVVLLPNTEFCCDRRQLPYYEQVPGTGGEYSAMFPAA